MHSEDDISLALILFTEFLFIFQAVNAYLAYSDGDSGMSLWCPVLWSVSSIAWGVFTIIMARGMGR